MLALIVLLVAAGRFVALDIDPPWDIVSSSGVFQTDEGWYSKAGLLLALTGHWQQPLDLTPLPHNPLHSLIMASVFSVFGASMIVARVTTALFSLASLLIFYLLSRTAISRIAALLATLAVATAFNNITYARTALMEPVGVFFVLAGLLIWTRGARRRAACSLSMALGAAAFFVKLSFAPALLTLAVLWILRAKPTRQEDRWDRSLLICLGCWVATIGTAHLARIWLGGYAWDDYQATVLAPRIDEMLLSNPLISGGMAVVFFGTRSGAGILLATLVVAGCIQLVATIRNPTLRRFTIAPVMIAMLIWGGTTFLMLAFSTYRPPRYFYPLFYPAALLAVYATRAFPSKLRTIIATMIVIAHVVLSGIGVAKWLGRENLTSGRGMAEQVAALTRKVGSMTTLAGRRAAWVSLFADHLRPLETGFVNEMRYSLCDRLVYYQPAFVLTDRREEAKTIQKCLGRDLTAIRAFDIMGNYNYDEPVVLWRVAHPESPDHRRRPGSP